MRIVTIVSRDRTNSRFRKAARTAVRSGRVNVCIRGTKKTGYIVSACCRVATVRGPGAGLKQYTKPAPSTNMLCDLSFAFAEKLAAFEWLDHKFGVQPCRVPSGKLTVANAVSEAA